MFMTFADWVKENHDINDHLPNCPYCRGTGESECHTCGSFHGCEECDGTGKKGGTSLKHIYQDLRREEEQKLERWGKEPIHA